ncbi:hypothetical protein Tco_1065504 [Tanacetum coccineum]
MLPLLRRPRHKAYFPKINIDSTTINHMFTVIDAYLERSIILLHKNTGALCGDELGRIKAFPDNSRSCTDNSFDSDGANDMAQGPQMQHRE